MSSHQYRPNILARLLITLIVTTACLQAGTVTAVSPTPQHADHPPVTPQITAPIVEYQIDPQDAVHQSLPALKAVLLVGPIDGDNGDWTTKEKVNMDMAADALTAHGVNVVKFYTPNNNWEDIKAAANGAHFLLYRGHGVYWPPPGMPSPAVGGFALKGKFASNDMIRNELKLAPNAIIMLYGCFTAGSAGNDETSISINEAVRRVAMYSDPFFDIGAGGYFADWFGEAFPSYINSLFAGKTQREAYESFWDFNDNTDTIFTHPDHPNLQLRLDKDNWYEPNPQYNNAFVGKPDATLSDLFGSAPEMKLSTNIVSVLMEPDYAPKSVGTTVYITTPATTTWTATLDTKPSWLSITKASGASGEAVTLQISPMPVGQYSAIITVISGDPNVINPRQTVTVRLDVVAEVHKINLPSIFGK